MKIPLQYFIHEYHAKDYIFQMDCVPLSIPLEKLNIEAIIWNIHWTKQASNDDAYSFVFMFGELKF